MEYTYNAGVLIIGSLFWDSNNNRDTWRLNTFGDSYWLHKRDVKAPLLYGRYSKERKCPTMVFQSINNTGDNLGNGLFLPFRREALTLDQLFLHSQDLSEAEGNRSRLLIKGSETKWCIVLAWLNDNMPEEKRDLFIEYWRNKYNPSITQELIDNFKYDNEQNSVLNLNGILQFNWPPELSDIDIVFVTQTQPCTLNGSKQAPSSPEIIATQILQRPEYFIKNRLNGITTANDYYIIKHLKESNRTDLVKNAIKNGCSQQEIDLFFKKEDFNAN